MALMDSIAGDAAIYKSDPVGSFNFVLTVEGIYDIPLKSVRAFQKVNQYEKIREGGVNDYVHLKRAPIQDAHTIQFERYVSASLVDPLANGAELTVPVILWLNRAANNGLTDAEKNGTDYSDDDYDTSSVRLYIFTGCTVMSKEYGALDAEKSGLATEVVTMGYKELYIVPNLYTFFGGGTDITSIGQMGELDNVDEDARAKFKEQQQKDYDAAVARNKKAAETANVLDAKSKKDFEEKQKAEYEAAVEEHKKQAAAAEAGDETADDAGEDAEDEAADDTGEAAE